MDSEIKRAISLCERVLKGDIAYEEISKIWPEPPKDNRWFDIWNDLHFAIEHTPGYWLKKDVNMDAWRKMPEYEMIESYLNVLKQGRVPESEWPSKKDQKVS